MIGAVTIVLALFYLTYLILWEPAPLDPHWKLCAHFLVLRLLLFATVYQQRTELSRSVVHHLNHDKNIAY